MTFSPTLQKAVLDAASMLADEAAMMAPFKPVKLDPVYRLTWTDPGYYDAPSGAPVSEYERTRDFKHLGGAIAWARRRIFHGHVFGAGMEMTEVSRTQLRDGTITESLADPIEITLPGFVRWQTPQSYAERTGYITGRAERKCKWDE